MATETKNEVAQKQEFNTQLSYFSNQYTSLIEKDFSEHGIAFDDYSKQCAMSAMSSIYQMVRSSKKTDMSKLNGSNLRQVLGQVASLKLNANAVPRECYFQLRSQQTSGGDWEQVVEMGIEGDGNDALLRNHGVNVDTVYPCWEVKDGDEFTYPKRRGLEIEPPEWEEKGNSQKVVRVVYPIKLKDGTIDYRISERESVKVNLFAHVRNNLMNETFGLVKGGKKTRYDATDAEKKAIEVEKEKIYEELRKCATVDEMLECKLAIPYISAAWLDTPESMIVRKMRNNATKKYPKSLNSIANQSLLEMDEVYQSTQAEISQNANSEDFEVESEIVEGDVVDADGTPIEESDGKAKPSFA